MTTLRCRRSDRGAAPDPRTSCAELGHGSERWRRTLSTGFLHGEQPSAARIALREATSTCRTDASLGYRPAGSASLGVSMHRSAPRRKAARMARAGGERRRRPARGTAAGAQGRPPRRTSTPPRRPRRKGRLGSNTQVGARPPRSIDRGSAGLIRRRTLVHTVRHRSPPQAGTCRFCQIDKM